MDLKTALASMEGAKKKLSQAKTQLRAAEAQTRARCDLAMVAILKNLQLRCHFIARWLGETGDEYKCVDDLSAMGQDSPQTLAPQVKDMVQKEVQHYSDVLEMPLQSFLKSCASKLPWAGSAEDFAVKGAMEVKCAEVLTASTPAELEELKTKWKASVDAACAIAASANKMAGDLMSHLKTRDAEEKRKETRASAEEQSA
eukprot:712709-Alexandrium_andersonii.AAC.1